MTTYLCTNEIVLTTAARPTAYSRLWAAATTANTIWWKLHSSTDEISESHSSW